MTGINPMSPRTSTVLLLQGDDQGTLDELDLAVERAKPEKGKTSTLDEAGTYQAAVEKRNKFAAAAEKRGVKVVVRALGRKTWRELVNANPPRDDHEADKAVGVNDETFPEALVPASLASPTFPSIADRDAFLDSLSDAQFQRLYATAFVLNRTLGADPKELRS